MSLVLPPSVKERRKSAAFSEWLREEALPYMLKAVCAAEEVKGLSGPAKLEHAASVLNGFVDIPYCPDWIEQYLFKFGLTLLVELGNRVFGKKEWYEEFMLRADLDKINLNALEQVETPKRRLRKPKVTA